MYTTTSTHATTSVQTTARAKAASREMRSFCPSIFCFTDEIVARRVNAGVWLLADETTDQAWLMMGDQPTCPHCGTTLLTAERA